MNGRTHRSHSCYPAAMPTRAVSLFLGAALCALALRAAPPPVQKQVFLSKVYTIDRKYRSMEGPGSIDTVYLGDPAHPELLWVTAIRTEMVREDGTTPQLPELMCHVNIDLDSAKHSALFGLKRVTATRLITLSQGMLDARFPAGFGYPIASNEPLSVFTQVLNLNIEHPVHLKVRHRITFEYIRDRDLEGPITPLFNVGASGTVLVDEHATTTHAQSAGMDAMPGMRPLALPPMAMAAVSGAGDHGVSCLVGPRAPNAVGGAHSDYTDPEGRKVTGHWVVPPGRQVNRSDITWFMQLPVDARLHWAAAHLHPYAKSLAIRDTTTGQTVFEVKAEGPARGIGLTHVDTFSSVAGVPMYKDHKYELVSVYDNPTRENSDSMASAFLALADPDFVRPTPAQLAERAARLLVDDPQTLLVVRTSVGDFGLDLFRRESPAAVRRFLHLAQAGAYDGATLIRSGDAMQIRRPTPIRDSGMPPFIAEHTAHHETGTFSMCPGSGTPIAIDLAAPTADESGCTAFARVSSGTEVVRAMVNAPPSTPFTIRRIDLYDPAALPITLAPAKSVPGT